MQRLEFRAMGSEIVAAVDHDALPGVLPQVPHWFEEWEQALSRFRADSELSQLNASSGMPRRVGETLWEVFAVAQSAGRLSQGLVNPLVLNALVHAGYDQSFEQLPANGLRHETNDQRDEDAISVNVASPSVETIRADAPTRTICLPEGSRLDFGGVAKGWAAHVAVQRLARDGPALVSAGGDVAVSGPRSNGGAWAIGVEDPLGGADYLEMIYLSQGGVATSGKDRRRWRRGDTLQHHVIDPRTGLPAATDVLTATVIAPTVMSAEAMAKAALIAGSQDGLARLDAAQGFSGMLVLDDGQRLYTKGFEEYL